MFNSASFSRPGDGGPFGGGGVPGMGTGLGEGLNPAMIAGLLLGVVRRFAAA